MIRWFEISWYTAQYRRIVLSFGFGWSTGPGAMRFVNCATEQLNSEGAVEYATSNFSFGLNPKYWFERSRKRS